MKRPPNPPPSKVISVPKIQYPDRPRILRSHIEATKKELSATGQIDPIIVSTDLKNENPKEVYTLHEGGIILEAARLLKWRKIRAIVLAHECPVPQAIGDWTELLKRYLDLSMSDYDLAEAAIAMEEKWSVLGTEFAAVLGLSKPYVYNLMRWYKHVPNEVRDAWRFQHPLISQAKLEHYSHLSNEEALRSWKIQTKMLGSDKPFKPNSENSTPKPRRPRRPTAEQIANLQEAIDGSPLTPEVKRLCSNILKFALGTSKQVPGITDYRKLPQNLVQKSTSRA